MARKRQLPGWRENPHARRGVGPAGREDEGRFGQVHLAGDGLHLVVAEAVRLQEYGQLIAAEDVIGEDVNLDEAVTAGHHLRLTAIARPRQHAF